MSTLNRSKNCAVHISSMSRVWTWTFRAPSVSESVASAHSRSPSSSFQNHALLILLSLSVLGLFSSRPVSAQEKSPEVDITSVPTQESGLKSGYRAQDSDDLALPLQPKVPLSAATETRNEALSWYMTGRFFDAGHRNELRRAISSFRKAIQRDPAAIEAYRNLVPMEFQNENLAAGVRYALKAIQLDPENFEILELLARHAMNAGQLPEAIKFLEQAIKSPRIQQSTPEFVSLNKLLGLLYTVTGQRDRAADCYEVLFRAIKTPEKFGLDSRAKNSLLADPTTNYEKIGQVLMDDNRLKLALEAFELAATTKQGAGNLGFNRAKILFLSDQYDEALAELQKYFDAQRTTKGRDAYQLFADILAKLNRSDELIGQLEKLADSDSQNVALQFFLADRLADVNELDKARKIYDTMLTSGGDASGYAGLARVLRKMQKSDELLDALGRGISRSEEAAARLQPEIQALSEDKLLVEKLLETGRMRAEAKRLKFEEALLLAKLASALKNSDASGEFYRLTLSINKNPNRHILLQMEMADMYAKLKNYRAAAEVYKETLASGQLNDFGRLKAYSSLAETLAHDNRTDEALSALSDAIKLDDDNPSLRLFESGILMHARRWEDAIRSLEQVMKDFSDNHDVIQRSQFSISNVYVQMGELRKGEEILEKVLEVNPDSSQANNDLGYLWADQGKNLERAEKMIRIALTAEPDNGAYLDSLGWVLFKLGKLEEAIPPLEQSLEKMKGSDITVWDHLGDVYLKLMRTEKAVEAWQTALQHSEDESSQDVQLMDRIKDKLKQHGSSLQPKPADKGSP